jgi:hypothetical protein
MIVLSREADKTISGASEVVAMAVTILQKKLISRHQKKNNELKTYPSYRDLIDNNK